MFIFRVLIFLTAMSVPLRSEAALYLPEFENRTSPRTQESLTLIHTNQFRVLIYPHLGEYAVPQGREPEIATQSVRVSCKDECGVYTAALDQDGNWYKSGPPLTFQKEFSLSAARFSELRKSHQLTGTEAPVLYYDCRAPFQVHRVAPLKSYEYSGSFVAYIDQKRVHIVNLVDPDTYLKGVIPSEVPSTWASEVLKVQAVAARTYAWWTVQAARTKPARFDMDDTVTYQAYLGNSSRAPETDAASDTTAGLILKYRGQPIKAYFSADSGGHTESAQSVFLTELPYCVAKPEQYDIARALRPTEWTKSFATADLQAILIAGREKMMGLIPRRTKIADLAILERNSSGRVQKLQLTATTGKKFVLLGTDFRYLTQIRSTWFDLKREGSDYVLNGRGYGHGVGMAQIGALAYHQQLGWKFDRILSFYYPGTVLETP
jgi:stage II sporulation protein D